MKWYLVMGLAALMLAGCGQQKDSAKAGEPSGGEKKKVAIVFDTGGRGDKSFNDSAWAGVQRAEKEFGIEVLAIDSKSEKDYETNLASVSDQGAGLVFAVGLNMQTALDLVHVKYQGTKFAFIDGNVDAPNVRGLMFKEEEGSFLVGYLAGLMTKTNKIGFVGGEDMPLIRKFENAYAAGAEYANEKVELLPPKYTGSWNNVDAARTAADLLFGSGADIIYHAAGRAGLGVIKAAESKKKYAIGVDMDQDGEAPGFVLTSMVKRVDEAVYSTIKDYLEGNFSAGAKVYGLAENGVGVSEFKYTREQIGAENLAKLESVKQRILSGEIKVPTAGDALVWDKFVQQLRASK